MLLEYVGSVQHLLLNWVCLTNASVPVMMIPRHACFFRHVFALMVLLPGRASPFAWEQRFCRRAISTAQFSSLDPEQATDYSSEETLLRLHLSLLPDVSIEKAKKRVSKYSQAFPFSAVLPVQPLTYLPTEDDGLEIRFLRKKTSEKSSIDGGIRFFIQETDDNVVKVEAKRNSVGQSVPKIFAERLVITSYVAGISGEQTERFGEPPTDVVRVQSVFHKWMDASIEK